MKQKIAVFLSLLFFSAQLSPNVALAQAADPLFNPSVLIDDRVFSDIQTFGGAAGIQKFLESKNSILANTSPEFTAKLKEPVATILKQALEDPGASLGRTRTAAELIWDSAQSSGLNPQVILVMLHKEQSLIGGHQNDADDRLQRALDFSLGFGCPDSQPCGELYRGFYFQLFGNLDSEGNRYLGATKSLMKSFQTPGGRGPVINGAAAKTGDVITLDNTLGGYDGVTPTQTLMLTNAATTALYRYTPHVFNGNYNFWRYFNSWFRYPNGTILQVSGDGNLYIIQNGARYKLLPFVAQARGLSTGTVTTASQLELESYPQQGLYGLPDNAIISVDGKLYVFMENVKRPASSFVITQRGLNPATAVVTSASDASNFTDGPALTPSDGTVLRGATDPGIYLVSGGVLKLYTAFTFAQHQASKKVQIIPDSEIASYPKQGFVAPLDGTLIKGTTTFTVYLMEGGQKRPLTGELFKNRGFSFKNIVTLSDDEVGALVTGTMPNPANNTYFKVAETSEFFLYQNGAKRRISSFVAAQKKMSPDYTFPQNDVASWPEGTPVVPRDGTIIKGTNADVYLVSGAKLRPLTFAAFQRKKITVKQISVLPQAEVDGYPKGDIVN
jgi:hypothetical protein